MARRSLFHGNVRAADKNANEIFLLYRATNEASGDYPGLPALPSGCITLASGPSLERNFNGVLFVQAGLLKLGTKNTHRSRRPNRLVTSNNGIGLQQLV